MPSFIRKISMQLTDEKTPRAPVADGAQVPCFPDYDPQLFAGNSFLSRVQNPPTFFQMLASLSDSPALHPGHHADTPATTSVSSRVQSPPTFSQMLASLSDSPARHPGRRIDTLATASVSIESTMDGRDTPVITSAVELSVPAPADDGPITLGPPVITRRRGLQYRKCHFSLQNIPLINKPILSG